MNKLEGVNLLSSVLGVPLELSTSGKICGGGVGSQSAVPGFPDIAFNLRVMASFVGAQVGAVFHVSGELFFLVSVNLASGAVMLIVIDGALLGRGFYESIGPSASISELLPLMSGGFVKAVWNAGGGWKPLSLSLL